jgi:hypothetical protein
MVEQWFVDLISVPTLRDRLGMRRYEELGLSQWEYFILSLLDELRGSTSNYLKGESKVPVIRSHSRDDDGLALVVKEFEEYLPLQARRLFSAACTSLTAKAHRATQEYDEEGLQLLRDLLRLSSVLNGCIEGGMVEVIVLDMELPGEVRAKAAYTLISKGFEHTPPRYFWEKVEPQLGFCPELARPLMHYYTETRRPLDALEVLGKFKPTEEMITGDIFQYPVQEAVKAAVVQFSEGVTRILEIFHRQRLWAKLLIANAVAECSPDVASSFSSDS